VLDALAGKIELREKYRQGVDWKYPANNPIFHCFTCYLGYLSVYLFLFCSFKKFSLSESTVSSSIISIIIIIIKATMKFTDGMWCMRVSLLSSFLMFDSSLITVTLQEGISIDWMSNVERFTVEDETVNLLLNKYQRHRGDTLNSRMFDLYLQ
jgi:hypothetical protein